MATFQREKAFILYDEPSVSEALGSSQISPLHFTADHWRTEGAVIGEAPGRGASLFLQASQQQWVLRPYRRGGLAARLANKRYLWTGLERSRAFRELRLTAELRALKLPVPPPVGACVWRHGATYEAALITVRLRGARALAAWLDEDLDKSSAQAREALLHEVGATIRRFHEAGLDHVDLNARNLLIDGDERVWLIDLDRCRLRRDGAWREANLQRLARSLEKFGAGQAMAPIREGYGGDIHSASKGPRSG